MIVRLIILPDIWIIIIDIVLWAAIHMIVAFGATQMKADRFNPDSWLYRQKKWEKNEHLYTRIFRIKQWKEFLPDGAAWFSGGFAKKNLQEKSSDYFQVFIKETCRGEFTHWIVLGFSPIFFLWNYTWAGFIIIGYAIIANVPCIIAQRYNRIRFQRILTRMSERKS